MANEVAARLPHGEHGTGEAAVLTNAETSPPPAKLLELAQSAYRARRRREKLLSADLFGEPGWDILLDMYANALKGKRASTTSLCLASMVPNTTALRWLDRLDEEGLIERIPSNSDARVRYLTLSAHGFRAMTLYFTEQMETSAKNKADEALFFQHDR